MNAAPARAGRSVLTITVTYKSASWTARSLRALAIERARQPQTSLTAIVVDNASGDAPELRQVIDDNGWGDWVTLVVAERNGGFAYGNNVAFAHAYASGQLPDYFFLLNPDAEIRAGAVEALVDFLEREPAAGLVGSSIEEADGRLWPYAFRFPSVATEVEAGLAFSPVTRLLNRRKILREMGEVPEQVDWLAGASLMMRRQLVDELGGLDESYFLYFEETDYIRRAREAGWQAWYVPASRVVHAAGQSTGVTVRRARPARLPDYWFESRRRYFAKNHGLVYAAATDAAALVAHALGAIKLTLQRRPRVPQMVPDLLRHSVFWPHNRAVAPLKQFRPPSARGAARPS
jgi:GT2 family glycosyltransferase